MKKRLFLALTYLLLTLLIFSSCGIKKLDKSLKNVTLPEPNSWSIFIYLCGTDLESGTVFTDIDDDATSDDDDDTNGDDDNTSDDDGDITDNDDDPNGDDDDTYEIGGEATANLEELLAVEFSDQVNVYVQTGGTSKWRTDEIASDKIQRFHISNHKLILLEEHELTSMGDPNTLENFLSWGTENYAADKMGVIFWNHGGGSLTGVAFDELFDHDSLTLPELNQAFSNCAQRFEFVGFDACLMATLEVACLLAPHANYLVASEEIEPGGGWDYTTWAQHLSNNPSDSGSELGKVICDSYYEKCSTNDEESIATLSVTNLNKIAPLREVFDTISKELEKNVNDITFFSEISRGAFRTETYGGFSPSEGYTNQIDLGDLISNIKEPLGEDLTNKLLSALDDTVVYSIKGSTRSFASGLSVFFPLQINEAQLEGIEDFATISPSRAYKSFVDSTIEQKETVASNINLLRESYFDENGTYIMEIDPKSLDYIESVHFSLFLEEENDLLSLGSNNNLFIDWKTGRVEDNFDGMWPTLNNTYVSYYILENTEEYIVYSIPILLNGSETNLRATWFWDEPTSDVNHDGHFEVLGAWAGVNSATGVVARDIISIKDGDVIIPLFYSIDEYDEDVVYEGKEIVVDGELVLEEQTLWEGDYQYAYKIIDIYGNTTFFDYATISIDEKGEMWIN